MARAKVLCVGAATWDIIFRVETIPREGSKVTALECVETGSGMATSAALAIAKLGGEAALLAAIGRDDYGRRFLAEVGGRGVDVSGVMRVADRRTALSTVLVDPSGERLACPYFDPRLTAGEPAPGTVSLAGCAAALCDTRWPGAAAAVLGEARARAVPSVLDADVSPPEALARLVPLADHVIFSRDALAAHTGDRDPESALAGLAERGTAADGCLGVTLGEDGFLGVVGGERLERRAPPPPAAVVDTLAAGDVFHGAFALGLAEGTGIEDALGLALAAATLKCTHFGGNLGAPGRAAVAAYRAQIGRTHEG